LLVEKYAEQW
jgi:hypothetical protein